VLATLADIHQDHQVAVWANPFANCPFLLTRQLCFIPVISTLFVHRKLATKDSQILKALIKTEFDKVDTAGAGEVTIGQFS
jgi:hypothetical protein